MDLAEPCTESFQTLFIMLNMYDLAQRGYAEFYVHTLPLDTDHIRSSCVVYVCRDVYTQSNLCRQGERVNKKTKKQKNQKKKLARQDSAVVRPNRSAHRLEGFEETTTLHARNADNADQTLKGISCSNM